MTDQRTEQETILTQWQTCVEMANAVSDRRDSMNNLFVTVNLALTAAVSFTWDVKSIILLAVGFIECGIWMPYIVNYKRLNSAKFSVINSLEEQLPVKPFTDEWRIVSEKKYKRSTNLEMIMPGLFMILYLVVFHFVICGK